MWNNHRPRLWRRTACGALAAAALLLLLPGNAQAMPRFAVQQGASCSMCHVNPSGGGARNAYGRGVYSRQYLSMGAFEEDDGAHLLDTSLGEWAAVGTDIRSSLQYTKPRAIVPSTRKLAENGGFLFMQGDLYVVAQPSKYFSMYLDHGAFGSLEIFARLGADLLSLKAGKFIPAYGWRLPDHTTYIREPMGFGPRGKDTGVSVVSESKYLSVELGAFNGAGPEAFLDTDLKRAYTARIEARAHLGDLNIHLGGSHYYNDSGKLAAATHTERSGVFGALGFGRLAWLFELDHLYDDFGRGASWQKGYAAYNELSLVLARGFQLAGTYEFRDPNTGVGEDAQHRVGLVINLFPWSFGEIEIIGRDTIANPANPSSKLLEGMVIFHAYL